MTVETHILGRNCTCGRCQIDLRPALNAGQVNHTKLKRGDRIGVISGLRFTKDSAYHITKHEYDSNRVACHEHPRLEATMKALRPEDQPRVDALMKIQKIVGEGWGGVMPNGNIVDRRIEKSAIPIPENSLLGVPKPKFA